QSENICRLPAKTGPCKAHITRFFFDHTKGKCLEFVYGGCDGNENNFVTLKDCEQTCLRNRAEEDFEDSEAEFRCVADGQYPNPSNCSTFIQCSNGIRHIMPCPKGLNYNVEKKECDYKCDAYCNKTLCKISLMP
ncbi:haemalin, partial [Nephila pilipes]